MTRHVRQLFKVKRSKVTVTRSRDVSVDKNAVTRQWMAISTSNFVRIINVRVGACGILSRSVGQKTGSRNMADLQNMKCKNQRRTSPKRRNFSHFNRKSGRRIERRCLNLHRKFINNCFCACAVQMLLKMAVNAAICSTFEVQYDKSTSISTTAIGHLGPL